MEDRIETVKSKGTSVSYPVYDGHGNMVATLAKNGSGYTIGNRRSFGAWGEIRQGATSGSPKGRYCANLGHLDDDESGLTYMRARYYEPATGRFLSEDFGAQGLNWFTYCGNNPINSIDKSGNDWEPPAWVGPAGGVLWWLSTFNGVIGVAVSSVALAKFCAALSKARDSLDVENAFGAFMHSFNKGLFSMVDGSGTTGLIASLLGFSLRFLNIVGGATSMAGVLRTLVTYAILGTQFTILEIAHSLRLAWYIDDIGTE